MGGGVELPNVSHCITENEVHYNPLPNANGHVYVDLGLPSGTLWATMNVGANSETDYGLYFQWGDTSGYTASQVGSGEGQKYFGWDDYKYGTDTNLTKYNATDGLTTLELSDDAARADWGGDWRMPTNAQFEELTANTTSAWTSVDGVSGVSLTSTADTTVTIFFPAASGCYNGSAPVVGTFGFYWTNILFNSTYLGNAYRQLFNDGYTETSYTERILGCSVRGVLNQ